MSVTMRYSEITERRIVLDPEQEMIVYENPSSMELRRLLDQYGELRGNAVPDGAMYVWDANTWVHDTIQKYLDIPFGKTVYRLYFSKARNVHAEEWAREMKKLGGIYVGAKFELNDKSRPDIALNNQMVRRAIGLSAVTEAKAETLTMFHGTLLANVPAILARGLIPSAPGEPNSRWATLGGVYLTNDLDYAVKAARSHAAGDPLAVIVAKVSTRNATPDEDVVEKALIKAFTSALDGWAIDDAYNADIERYADAEEHRPLDYDEHPFDRSQFYKEFWANVIENMSRIAGAPIKRNDDLVRQAVEMALRMVNDEEPPNDREIQQWQIIKTNLITTYPRLRSETHHAQSGLIGTHAIRLTTRVRPNQIIAVLVQKRGKWTTMPGFSIKTDQSA
jgi:hypothetical protein